MASRAQRLALATIVLMGLALRLWGIDFGLPNVYCRPDETTLVHRALAIGAGDPNPHFFNYPSLHFYLLALAYGAYFATGYVAGIFSSLADFERLYFSDPSPLFLIGRYLTALLGTASIALVYLIGKELQRVQTGLLGAFFFAVSLLHVRDSHFLTVDVTAVFFALAAALCALLYMRTERVRALVGSAVCFGLAASTKYNLALLFPIALYAIVHVEKQRRLQKMAFAVLAAALAFFLTSPFVLLDATAFWRDLSFERAHFARGHGIDLGWGWAYHALFSLPVALGWPLYLVAALGLASWAWRGAAPGRALLVGFLCYYIIAGSGKLVFVRYVLPLVPLLCLAAADQLERWGRCCAGRVPVWVLPVLLALPVAHASWQHGGLLARRDTRVLAAEWIEARVQPGARIALCGVSDYDFVRLRRTAAQLQRALAEQRAAGMAAQRLERRLRHAAEERRPAYEIAEYVVRAEPSSVLFDEIAAAGAEWLVVHERAAQVGHWTAAVPESLSVERFDPFVRSGGEGPVYDPLDAFHVPLARFGAVERPGPRISIYRIAGDARVF